MSGITDLHFCPCRNAFSETMGWLLALDGATEHLALALVAPDGRVHAQELAGGAQASAKLLPSLKAWMAAQRVQASQLAALVLGRGLHRPARRCGGCAGIGLGLESARDTG